MFSNLKNKLSVGRRGLPLSQPRFVVSDRCNSVENSALVSQMAHPVNRYFELHLGPRLSIGLPCWVRYIQNDNLNHHCIAVKAESLLAENLTIKNGSIIERGNGPLPGYLPPTALAIEGPGFESIELLRGCGLFEGDNLKQSVLNIRAQGACGFRLSGRVKRLEVDQLSQEYLNCKDIEAQDVALYSASSGDVSVSAHHQAELSIFNRGNVILHGQPKKIIKQGDGAGRIVERH